MGIAPDLLHQPADLVAVAFDLKIYYHDVAEAFEEKEL
jgi:hypothetical protein